MSPSSAPTVRPFRVEIGRSIASSITGAELVGSPLEVLSLSAPQLLCHGGRRSGETPAPRDADSDAPAARSLRRPRTPTVTRHDTVSRGRQRDERPGRKNSIVGAPKTRKPCRPRELVAGRPSATWGRPPRRGGGPAGTESCTRERWVRRGDSAHEGPEKDAMALRIEDYALIGNCQTAALVGRDGS